MLCKVEIAYKGEKDVIYNKAREALREVALQYGGRVAIITGRASPGCVHWRVYFDASDAGKLGLVVSAIKARSPRFTLAEGCSACHPKPEAEP